MMFDNVAAILAACLLLSLFPVSAFVFLANRWMASQNKSLSLCEPSSWFTNMEGLTCFLCWLYVLLFKF